ncbi:MAG: hypothetical protein R3A79_30705 [Nannocystaceae bacterium]
MAATSSDSKARAALAVVVGAVALTAGRALWAADDAPWWSPFALWAALLAVGVALARLDRPAPGEADPTDPAARDREGPT